jgi:DNA-binding MarR family transcriptional regulator
MIDDRRKSQVDQFIIEQIDSVPHLEALLLIWNNRPQAWSAKTMGESLYVRTETAAKILDSLAQRKLIAATPDRPGSYIYHSYSSEADELLKDVDATYRKEIVRISSLIHSKATAGVRDFARAFRFTKDKE